VTPGRPPGQRTALGRRHLSAWLAALLVLGSVGAAAAQESPTDPGTLPEALLDVASVSPWVEPDGVFEVRFDPSPEVPEGSSLTVTIHEAIDAEPGELRDELLEILDGGSTGRILQAPITVPYAELGDPAGGALLEVPVRARTANSDRVLLPNPGVHPVELVLTGPDGPEVWRQVVFLNRLPLVREGEDDPARTRQLPVNLVMPLETGPALDPSGAAAFTLEDRTRLGAGGALLRAVPRAPLLIGARPNTLDGLDAADTRWADRVLEALSDDQLAAEPLLMTYSALDTAGVLDTGARGVFDRQLFVGAGRTIEHIDVAPSPGVWALDPTLSESSLPALAAIGVESILVDHTALAVDDDPAALVEVMNEPFLLSPEEPIRGLALDDEISGRLTDTGADPSIRAHEATSLLMANWFDGIRLDRADRRAAAVLVQPVTDPETLEQLSAALLGNGPLRTGLGETLPDVPLDDLPVVPFAPSDPPDQRPAVDAAVSTSEQLAAWRSMTADADPQLDLWERLNDQSLSIGIDPPARDELHASIAAGLGSSLGALELPRPRRVILTSEDTTIPLRFRNDLDFEVRLELTARSPRLDLGDDGTTEVVLVPGENRVDLPVNVRAPGETLLRLQVSSPDGQLALGSVDVPVRSTAISGVGAALSVISLGFLVFWWILTHRRRRREAARMHSRHPTAEGHEDREPPEPGPTPSAHGTDERDASQPDPAPHAR